MIIFVGGNIGAGKSSVAKGLAEHLSLHYYDVDELKRGIYQTDPDYQKNMEQGIPFCEETRMKVYEKAVGEFAELAQVHQHMVVDETLHRKKLRDYLFEGARQHFGGYVIIWVKASEEVILRRLTSQVRDGHLLRDPVNMHLAFHKEFEPFEESIVICRNESTLESTIEEISQLFDNIAICSSLARA
jgi:gluconate kinase